MGQSRLSDEFVTHVETGTVARVKRAPISRVIDKWLKQGGPLFPQEARTAIEHCERLWQRCPTLGRLTASYEPRVPAGSRSHEDTFELEAAQELGRIAGWFPAEHWRVFEAMVRDGQSAGEAGRGLATSRGETIIAVKALVASMACTIASRKGWSQRAA